jgi:hypothetical protein
MQAHSHANAHDSGGNKSARYRKNVSTEEFFLVGCFGVGVGKWLYRIGWKIIAFLLCIVLAPHTTYVFKCEKI